MIFVTVGTDKLFGFKRLIEACDQIAREVSEPMLMQIACTNYTPKHAQYFRYAPLAEYLEHYEKASLVISHCSIGPIVNAKRFRKPLIVCPRRYRLGELADEHQLDFARTVEDKKMGHVQVVYEPSEIKKQVEEFMNFNPVMNYNCEGLDAIVGALKDFIETGTVKTEGCYA
ncbi:MAG: hypothetical protein JW893_00775 [Candidatus Omnitrophica bacterium]|nr:hypothetical protein [Candidatus Omnitrophota bacterium]